MLSPSNRLILVLLLALFPIACTGSGEEDDGVIRLTAWVTYQGPEKEKFLKLIDQFTREYKEKTGKTVKIIPKQVPFDDLITNIKMACMSGRTPDIARVDVQKIQELAYHKVLVKLDRLESFDSSSIDDKAGKYMKVPYYTNVVEVKTVDGTTRRHLYGLPEQTSCLALFWNRRLFREFGRDLEKAGLDPKRAPRTWNELIAYGKVLTRKVGDEQYYGFAMRNSLWWTLPFFGAFGAEFIRTDEAGKKVCNLGDVRSVAALQLKVDLHQKYGIEGGAWKSGAIGNNVGFVNEKYAMIMMGPWRVQEFREKKLDFGVSLIPRVSDERAKKLDLKDLPKSATNVGGNNFVVFRSCRHQQVAYDFINYMTSWKVQLEWCRDLKQIPINRRAASILMGREKAPGEAKIEVDPIIATFMEQIQYASLPPGLPRMGYIEGDVCNPEMELALKGEKSVEAALKSAADKIDRNILSLVNE